MHHVVITNTGGLQEFLSRPFIINNRPEMNRLAVKYIQVFRNNDFYVKLSV